MASLKMQINIAFNEVCTEMLSSGFCFQWNVRLWYSHICAEKGR